jgi:hypothetical protein
MQAILDRTHEDIAKAILLNAPIICRQLYDECVAAREHLYCHEFYLENKPVYYYDCSICQYATNLISQFGFKDNELSPYRPSSKYLIQVCNSCCDHIAPCLWELCHTEKHNHIYQYVMLCEFLGRDVAMIIISHYFIVGIYFENAEGDPN